MPYKRTYKRRATRRPRRKNTAVRTIARAEAKKVVARAVETKILDTSVTGQAVDFGAGYVVSMTNTMIRGIAENQYIGDAITPVGLALRCQLTRIDATQLFRVLIIQNKAGGVPLTTTVFQSTGNITAPLSALNVDYNNTYRVLYDKMFSMDVIRDTTKHVTIRIAGKRLRRLNFNDAIGTIEKAGLYMVVISDSGVVAHPTIDFRARLYYKDA